MKNVLLILGAYAFGNILTGYVLAKYIYHQEIQNAGSGNIGARNAGRLFGKKAFIITAIADGSKGIIIVLIAKACGFSSTYQLILLFAVIIGHIFPIVFRFKGGKGMATFTGGLLAFEPLLFLSFVCVFIIFFLIIRSLTIAAMIAVASVPLLMLFFSHPLLEILLYGCISIIVIFAHRQNIREKILGERKIS